MIRFPCKDEEYPPYVPLDEKDFAAWNIDEPTDHDDDPQEFTLEDMLGDD